MALPFAFIPGCIFGLFAIWPVALVAVFIAEKAEQIWPWRQGWPAWLFVGALLGGPAMYAHSFLLGLGQDLLLPLLANGVFCGLFCAAMTRFLVGPDILDARGYVDHERSGGPI